MVCAFLVASTVVMGVLLSVTVKLLRVAVAATSAVVVAMGILIVDLTCTKFSVAGLVNLVAVLSQTRMV